MKVLEEGLHKPPAIVIPYLVCRKVVHTQWFPFKWVPALSKGVVHGKISKPITTLSLSQHYNYYFQLGNSNAEGSRALYKVNPDYFFILPQPAVQLILIHAHYSRFCPEKQQMAMKNWMLQMDYSLIAQMIH